MNGKTLKKKYFVTLRKDPKNSENCVMIPVDDYEDIGCIQYHLINAINLIADSEENSDNTNLTISYISRLLKGFHTADEHEALSKFEEIL